MSVLGSIIPPRGIVRLLAVSNLAKTTAHGVLLSISVLYFTRVVGIAPERVGLALSIGAAIGMVTSVPAGRLAEVRGPRPVTVVLLILLGVAASGYVLVHSFAALVVATALALGAESAANAARGALLAGLLPQGERPRALAYMRSTANIGVSLGAVSGGLGLLFNSRAGYIGLLLTAGALFAVSGLAFLRVPAVPATAGVHAAAGPKLPVLRDLPYATICLLNAVLVMVDALLIVAAPVWISLHTKVPPFFFTVMLLVNTSAVILLQVKVSEGSETLEGSVRAWRRAGLAMALCCAIFAFSAGQPVWLCCVILMAAALAQALGEMLQSAGGWQLGYDLAPEHAQGQYQGLFQMSTQLGTVVAPLAILSALSAFGAGGWLLCAGAFLVAGYASRPAAHWARRTRTPAEPAALAGADT